MKIITVVPITSGVFKETLSYFSTQDVPLGSIIEVPVRRRLIPALVVESENVEKKKAAIKSSSFTLKKIAPENAAPFFSVPCVHAAKKTAEYYATTTGEVLKTLIPKEIIEDHIKTTQRHKKQKTARKHRVMEVPVGETFVLQADDKERMATYRSIVRESFAKNKSVFLCLPQTADVLFAEEALKRGIDEYTVVLHGNITPKKLKETWRTALASEHPLLIIATRSFLALPREDIGTLIIDKEGSSKYKTFTRPLFDIRSFAQYFSQAAGIKLIFGGMTLRAETIHHAKTHTFIPLAPIKSRALSSAEHVLADMRAYRADTANKKPFTAISEALEKLLYLNKEHNEHLFIFTARKGLAPITICNDCGEIVTCEKCVAPMILHKDRKKKENIFLCHRCGALGSAHTVCTSCKSWRLVPLGIGMERVEDEIAQKFPDVRIFTVSGDTTTTHKQIVETVNNFYASPGSVLLGTEMAIPYLTREIESSAIIGIDSLFAVPDFRMNERIFELVLAIRSRTTNTHLIQTSNPDNMLFTYIVRGDLAGFYRNELEERKAFHYPPFAVLVKISYLTTARGANGKIKEFEEMFADYDPAVYTSTLPDPKGRTKINALLRLAPDKWVDEKLLALLRGLPPAYLVEVDPRDLL